MRIIQHKWHEKFAHRLAVALRNVGEILFFLDIFQQKPFLQEAVKKCLYFFSSANEDKVKKRRTFSAKITGIRLERYLGHDPTGSALCPVKPYLM